MDILLGVFALGLGLAICFAGLWFFFVMLPIWGFVAGFLTGAAAVTALFGDGFLSTTFGLVVGLVVGVVFALLSYLYWYFAVLLAFGYTGGILGAALFATFGVDSSWLLFLIGLIGGVLFVVAAIALNLPLFLVVANTALAGSAIALGGVLLVFNRIDRGEIGTGAVWERISDNWFLWIVWFVLAALGIGSQLRSVAATQLPADRWTRAQPV